VIEDELRRIVREEVIAAVRVLVPVPPPARLSERITVKEAASAAKVSKATVRVWIKAGHLTTYWAGHQQRIDAAELERLMRDGPRVEAQDKTPIELAHLHLARKNHG